MAKICYTRNGVKRSLLSLTEKITTPSIKISGPGGTFYTPLFTGNTGNTRDVDRWRYTLSGFKVGDYHAAESRAWINRPPVIRLLNYPAKTNGTGITFTIEYSDEDNDNCTIEYGCQRPYYGNIDNVKRGSVAVSASSNAQRVNVSVDSSWTFDNNSYYSVYAKITDPSGESAIATAKIYKNSPPSITGWIFVDNDHPDLILRSIAPGIEFTQRMIVSDPEQYDFQCDAYLTTNYDGGSSWTYQYDVQQISNSNITVYAGIECSPYIHVVCNNGEGLTSKLRINAKVTDGYDTITGAKEITISRHENCLYLIDHNTRYTGEVWRDYGINKLTGIYGRGLPYLEVIGLPSSWVGKNVDYRIVQDGVTGFKSQTDFPDLNFEGIPSGSNRLNGTVYVNDTDNLGSGVRLCNGQNPYDADLKRNSGASGFQPNYHGWVHLGTGFLPYGKFTIMFYYVDSSKIVDVQCCHVSNACTGHGSLPILSGRRVSWINGNPYT